MEQQFVVKVYKSCDLTFNLVFKVNMNEKFFFDWRCDEISLKRLRDFVRGKSVGLMGDCRKKGYTMYIFSKEISFSIHHFTYSIKVTVDKQDAIDQIIDQVKELQGNISEDDDDDEDDEY